MEELIGTATTTHNGLMSNDFYSRAGINKSDSSDFFSISIKDSISDFFILLYVSRSFAGVISLYTDQRTCRIERIFGNIPQMFFDKNNKILYTNSKAAFKISYVVYQKTRMGYLNLSTYKDLASEDNGEKINTN